GGAKAVLSRLSPDYRLYFSALAFHSIAGETEISLFMRPKGDDASGPRLNRARAEQIVMFVVSRQNSDAVLDEPQKDLGLGFSDFRGRTEMLEMSRRDRRHHRDMGRDEARQRRDFASVIHPDFEHAEIR